MLVVGLGPAGYTLAHHLLNEGFGVVGIDGLKIEPLPERADRRTRHSAARADPRLAATSTSELDERIARWASAACREYGITVRWDKNFLTLLYLTLARRQTLRMYGGVRFGGTLDRSTTRGSSASTTSRSPRARASRRIVDMKNNLLRGIRKASATS